MSDEIPMVSIPLDVAMLIDEVFLPRNPNKCRTAHEVTLNAVRIFKAQVNIVAQFHSSRQPK